MNGLVEIIVPIICAGVLPIMVVWFIVRHRMNETNKRTEIVLAAIEKNPEMDVEELVGIISSTHKLLKEKLLTKLLWGTLISFVGIVLFGWGIYLFYTVETAFLREDALAIVIPGLVLLAIGIAFLLNYGIGKRMLAKEIEAEEKAFTTKD